MSFPPTPKRLVDPTVHKEITASSSGTQGGATTVGANTTIITVCVADGYSVRLQSRSEAPTIKPGARGEVWNRTTKAAAFFPPSGKKLYLNGTDQTVNVAVLIEPGARMAWLCDNNENFVVGS